VERDGIERSGFSRDIHDEIICEVPFSPSSSPWRPLQTGRDLPITTRRAREAAGALDVLEVRRKLLRNERGKRLKGQKLASK